MRSSYKLYIQNILRAESISPEGSFQLVNKDGISEYKNSDRLIQFYNSLENDYEKSEFIVMMLDNLDKSEDIEESNNVYSKAALAFATLCRIGQTRKTIASFSRRLSYHKSNMGIILVIPFLINNLNFKFTFDQIDELIDLLITKYPKVNQGSPLGHCLNLLQEKAFKHIDDKLNQINIEINSDKIILIEKIKNYGFDEEYNILLAKIDSFIYSDDELEISGMIGNLRSFMEKLIKDISNRILSHKNEKLPKYENRTSEMGRRRKYIQTQFGLSKNEDELIDNYISLLHKEGGHKFLSTKEYFRISKNIGIEIALFLISKMTDYFGK